MKIEKRRDRKFTSKPWGYEDHIWNGDYCGKLLHMHGGKCLSWHKHLVKEESFYLQSGKVILYFGFDEDIAKAEIVELNPGDSFHVPVGLIHRLEAVVDSDIFEFSTHHEDSDSIRLIPGN